MQVESPNRRARERGKSSPGGGKTLRKPTPQQQLESGSFERNVLSRIRGSLIEISEKIPAEGTYASSSVADWKCTGDEKFNSSAIDFCCQLLKIKKNSYLILSLQSDLKV
uniref:(northern house mosquito) hypothetical protein n=1 Tax=Culex pipiens TaxID=7175 RepID=A0A8D8AAF8_CULPI